MRTRTITPDIAARYGLAVNQNNGTYKPGVSYGIERKLEVAGVYQRLEDENQGSRPKISDVATECDTCVSTKMVRKIEAELSTVSQLSSSNWEQPHCPSALWEQASLVSDEVQEEEAKLQRIWQQSGWLGPSTSNAGFGIISYQLHRYRMDSD